MSAPGASAPLTARIEQRILTIEGVNDAAVLLAEGVLDPQPLVWILYSADQAIDPKRIGPAMPRSVHFRTVRVEAIPRNATGKIDRAWLRMQVQAANRHRPQLVS